MVIHHLLSGMILQVAIDETNLQDSSEAWAKRNLSHGKTKARWMTNGKHVMFIDVPIFSKNFQYIFKYVPIFSNMFHS